MTPMEMMISQLTGEPLPINFKIPTTPLPKPFVFQFDEPKPVGNDAIAAWNNRRVFALIRQWPAAAGEDGFTIGNIKRLISIHCTSANRAVKLMIKTGEVKPLGFTRKGGDVYQYVGGKKTRNQHE